MLRLLVPIYRSAVGLRNALYDRGVFASHDLGAKTISIGNITAGGTGKTPLVTLVAEILAEKGEKVCILTRGYGRANPRERVLVSDGETVLADAKTGGDEPVELARKLIGKAFVVADANRVSAAKWAKEEFGVTAFVLDDGFQHRRAKRDLDIVCIDATNPFGNRQMLPAGILREPLKNLKRADVVVITRADMAEDIEDLRSEISNIVAAKARIFLSETRISEVIALEEFHARAQRPQSSEIQNRKALAFCALGNPTNFFKQVEDKFEVASVKDFPDHHFYTQNEIDKLAKRAKENRAEILLTTAKDAVKLIDLKFEIPCFVVEIETVVADSAFLELF
jgi:tetraacyldisaccharide 4'-kinase